MCITLDDGIVVEVFFVYIVRCCDQSLYIGLTEDIESRVSTHNKGTGSVFTAARLPVVLGYSESYRSRIEAVQRERQIKRWTRAKKEALIARDLARLKRI